MIQTSPICGGKSRKKQGREDQTTDDADGGGRGEWRIKRVTQGRNAMVIEL